MHFAVFGHSEPLLELLKQVHALGKCRVGLPAHIPGSRENCGVTQMLFIGPEGVHELCTVRAEPQESGCTDSYDQSLGSLFILVWSSGGCILSR